MSEPNEFHADEIRAAARRIQAVPDDTDRISDLIADAAHRAAAANRGFVAADRLTAMAEAYRHSITGFGERLTDQADRITKAVDAREAADEDAAAAFDRIDPPS